MAKQFGGYGGCAAADVGVKHDAGGVGVQGGDNDASGQPKRKRGRVRVFALRDVAPNRGQFGVHRFEFLANQMGSNWLVEPVDALFNLPKAPAADVGGDNPVPDDFLLDRPVSSAQPVHRVEHHAALPADLVVVEERSARRGCAVDFVQDIYLILLVFGFGKGVFVGVVEDVLDKPALVLFLLVVGRRSDADVDNFVGQFLELSEGVAEDQAIKVGHRLANF